MSFLQTEEEVHLQLCKYLSMQYPDIEFNSDLSGINQSKTQRGKSKRLRSGRAFPDLVIYEPRGVYHGLFIELKRPGTRIYKKDGNIVANKHIREQADKIYKLRKKGYCAAFCIGFAEAKDFITRYLKLEKIQ